MHRFSTGYLDGLSFFYSSHNVRTRDELESFQMNGYMKSNEAKPFSTLADLPRSGSLICE